MNRSLHNNIRTIYLMGFFHSFMVVIPVFVPLLQGYGLSMSQVLQTQAMFALTIALCEVPSGYIADMWGRRRAILVGSALNAAGFFSLLWADGFVDFLVYEIFLGVGFSLISGADLALLYDTEVYLQERGLPGGAGAGKSLSRLISVEAAASGIAGVVASILLLWSLDGVVLVQAFTGFMPLLLGLGVMFGFAIQASRGVSMSLFYEALNRRVPGEFRATVNSLVSLGVRSIFIVTGPVLGFALDSQGMSSTLLVLVAIFTPLMGLVLVPLVIRIRRESDSREMGLI